MEGLHLFLCFLLTEFSTAVSFSSNPIYSIINLISTFCVTAFLCFFFCWIFWFNFCYNLCGCSCSFVFIYYYWWL